MIDTHVKLAKSFRGIGRTQKLVSTPAVLDRRGTLAKLRENLAANLERLIQERGFDQKSFAKEFGVAEGMLSRWLNLKHFPSDRHIDRLVLFFKCSYEDLVRSPGKDAPAVPVQVDAAIRELARRAGYKLVKDS